MSSRSSSPSLSSDNDSKLSSSLSEDFPEISEGEFIPYDEKLEPVATQEEAAAYEQNVAREEEHDMYQRRSAGEVKTNSWYVLPSKQLVELLVQALLYLLLFIDSKHIKRAKFIIMLLKYIPVLQEVKRDI